MKCSACQLELIESPKDHYKSDLHKINVQRQIYYIPPITLEEFTSKGQSLDISLDINFLEKQKIIKNDQPNEFKHIKPKNELCMLCNNIETFDHYKEHGLNDEEIVYLYNKTCYVCNEGFTNRPSLKYHLESENHRTAILRNNELVLENGKVLSCRQKSINHDIVVDFPKSRQIMHVKLVKEVIDKKNKEEKNKLKVSMGMNSQKHFRPDWMQ